MTMKLYYSPFSPYARKCRAVAVELGLDDRIELVTVDPRASGTGFEKVNPLSRIPAMVLDDGSTLFDSPVICEYLDHLGGGKLFPAPGPSRWHALKLQALGDGIMDAAVPRRQESMRPDGQRSDAQLALYRRSIDQTLDLLEGMTPLMKQVTIGTIAVAAGIGYLDLRFADDNWRNGRPNLAGWFAEFAKRPSIAGTAASA